MPVRVVRLDTPFVERARMASRLASVLVMLTGALAFGGWMFDAPLLKSFYADITIKANAALALMLAGASLFLLGGGAPDRWRRRAGQILAVVVGGIGLATMSQHLFGWNAGIDQLLFTEGPGAVATTSPGRMGPPAATCFALVGLALFLLHDRRSAALAQAGALGVGFLALLAVTGYAYGVETLYGVAHYTGIALHTAVALLVLSIGTLAASVDRGVAAVVAGEGAGSVMARRLFLIAISVPLLLGWVRIQLEGAGYVDTRFGIAALILTIIVILATFIAHTAITVNRVEQRQLAAEAMVRDRLDEIETMMEVLPIGVFIATDRPASEITLNRAARRLLRWPKPADARPLQATLEDTPSHFRVLSQGIELPTDDLPVRRAARDGVAIHDLEVEIAFPDGTVRHEVISALPLLDERGTPRGAVSSMMDITARKLAEREREDLIAREREARMEAEAANRAKDEFLATISHDLRTPINAILGWTWLLRDGKTLDEDTRLRALTTIDRNCKAQARLIDDLLDVARIVAGTLQLDLGTVDLVAIIDLAADAVRPAADAKRIQLLMRLDSEASQVRGDSARLQQVAWNLFTNAVKFSAADSAIEIGLTTCGQVATLTVADAGEGIDPAFLPHVFERFRQADGTSRRHGGVGLGLSIARNLVELHGGTLEASSIGIGFGSSFVMRLPLLSNQTGASSVMVSS